jgi:ABC-type multidrug transport system ATPase subunit
MDPGTRRFLWSFLQATRVGRAVILTTHSMEEADALCDRIGIMVAGGLRAVGSSQELKSSHGAYFSLVVRLAEGGGGGGGGDGGGGGGGGGGGDALTAAVLALSPGAELEDGASAAVLSLRKYRVPRADVSLGDVFAAMQEARAAGVGGLVDFSVSQTTLEDVFISFAKKQV